MDQGIGSAHPLGDPKLVLAFLDQGEAWKSSTGYTRVADMTPAGRRAAGPGIASWEYTPDGRHLSRPEG